MVSMKEIILWVLTIYSAEPEAINREPCTACAACAAAYATLDVEQPKPQPAPDDGCCGECNGTGSVSYTHLRAHET